MKDNIKELTLTDLVDKAVELKAAMEDMDAGIRVIKDELGDRLRDMKVTGTKVGNVYVSRIRRYNYSGISMSQALELGCTKQAVDTRKLDALVKKGVKLRGVKMVEFIMIKEGGEK